MSKSFVEELRWRGLLHDSMPGVEEHLAGGVRTGYVGFDPTADSLHVGNLVPIMLLVHFQRCGHKPIALLGGATGMVGDPSGKNTERQLLSDEQLQHNVACQRAQLEHFLDFTGPNAATLANNIDWFKDMGFLRFIREVGKHISVNYMMAKDSVKNRLETGISFTEFSYQLVQGYDFYWLWKNKGCTVQMGGSDQWGNITTGTELIRRMDGGEAWAVTNTLITKADGTKFGKSEGGNVWLDPAKTSPYKFHQFWLNTSDEDAVRYVKIFTTWSQAEIDSLVMEHGKSPHLRRLQRELANDLTKRAHGENEAKAVDRASEVIFGNSTIEDLRALPLGIWDDLFESLPHYETVNDPDGEPNHAGVSRLQIEQGLPIHKLLWRTSFLPSASEARRAIQEKSIAVNKEKILDESTNADGGKLIHNKYLLLQRGKKNYFLVKVAG